MPHFPVRESQRLAALFVDPREHAVVGRALHMLLDDVEHRAQAIILWQYVSGAAERRSTCVRPRTIAVGVGVGACMGASMPLLAILAVAATISSRALSSASGSSLTAALAFWSHFS
eukprot:scaffold87853_cov90-Phaeocystis_antarctica.AAC.1